LASLLPDEIVNDGLPKFISPPEEDSYGDIPKNQKALGVKLYAEPVLLAPEVGTPEF
jgi:hypothetical protein